MSENGSASAAEAAPGAAGVVCRGLTKVFGDRTVVHDLTFTAPMGAVTGFVGVNGAGKTTTLRTALGLVKPTSGEVLVAGRPYSRLRRPRATVGAVLEGPGAHPGQTGRAYLKVLAAAAGVGPARVTEVLELVGLGDDGGRRAGRYSLGMRQRLGLAGALLADPGILVLDEPTNGLDPLGIRWIRQFLKDMAREGRCVLVSSHQLSELEATADRVVMIHHGKLIADVDMGAEGTTGGREVVVGSPHAARLVPLVESAGGSALLTHDQELVVTGLPGKRIGEVAAAAGVVLHSLAERGVGLEETFLRLAGADGAASAPDGSAARAAEPVVPAEESTGGGR